MKVMVTGATGNVGRYIVKALLEMGQDVVAAGTDTQKLNSAFEGNHKVTCVYFDFTKPATFARAFLCRTSAAYTLSRSGILAGS